MSVSRLEYKNELLNEFADKVKNAGIVVPAKYGIWKYPNGLEHLQLLPIENLEVLKRLTLTKEFWSPVKSIDALLSVLKRFRFLDFEPYIIQACTKETVELSPVLVVDAFHCLSVLSTVIENSKEIEHVFCVTALPYDACEPNLKYYSPTIESNGEDDSFTATKLFVSLLDLIYSHPVLLKDSNQGLIIDFYYQLCEYFKFSDVPDRDALLIDMDCHTLTQAYDWDL